MIKQELSVKLSLDEQIEHYTKLLRDLKNKKLEELDNEMKKRLEIKPVAPKKGIDLFFEKKDLQELTQNVISDFF